MVELSTNYVSCRKMPRAVHGGKPCTSAGGSHRRESHANARTPKSRKSPRIFALVCGNTTLIVLARHWDDIHLFSGRAPEKHTLLINVTYRAIRHAESRSLVGSVFHYYLYCGEDRWQKNYSSALRQYSTLKPVASPTRSFTISIILLNITSRSWTERSRFRLPIV